MYSVYILQAIGFPEGNVKVGHSKNVTGRAFDLMAGALGERLQVIFQVEAGPMYSDGAHLEKVYHDRFRLLRVNREWFRFDPEMLTWVPDDHRHVYGENLSPAVNTIPAVRLDPGDLTMFKNRPAVREVISQNLPEPGNLLVFKTHQKVVQRV